MSTPRTFPLGASLLLAASLSVFGSACGDDDSSTGSQLDGGISTSIDGSTGPTTGLTGDGSSATPSLDGGSVPSTPVTPGTPAPVTPSADPLFVLSTAVAVGDTQTTYVKTVKDVDATSKIDLKNTLEQPGFGDIILVAGKLYVTNSEAPTVTRYTIGQDGSFTKDGDINFGSFTASADLYNQTFVSATKAILKGETSYIVWNPTTLKIEVEIPLPAEIVDRGAIKPFYAYDRAFHARGNRVFHAVSYLDYVNFKMTPTSSIVVIDTDNNKILSVLEAPCPALDTATQDSAGNIYFSPWVYGPGATIINGDAKGCAVKIAAGTETVDPTFQLTFAEITGGHEAAALRYMGGNKYLMSVFHEEKKAYDASKDKISEWLFSDSWTYATYDIVTKEFKEIPELGYSSGGYYSSSIGERFYILSPSSDYGSTTYKQLLNDGTSKVGISMDGWSTKVFQVR